MSDVKYTTESWAAWYYSEEDRKTAEKNKTPLKNPPEPRAVNGHLHELTIRWTKPRVWKHETAKANLISKPTLRLVLTLTDQVKADIGEDEFRELRYDIEFTYAYIYDWARFDVEKNKLKAVTLAALEKIKIQCAFGMRSARAVSAGD